MSIFNDLIPKNGEAPPKVKEEGFLKRAARAVLPESLENKIVGPKPVQPKTQETTPTAIAPSSIYADLIPKTGAALAVQPINKFSDLVPKTEEPVKPGEEKAGIPGTIARTLHSAVLDIGKSFFTGLRATSEVLSGEGKPLISFGKADNFREIFKERITKPLIEKSPTLKSLDEFGKKTAGKIKDLVLSPIAENSKAAIKALDEKQLEIIKPIFDEKPGLSNVNEYIYTIGSGAVSLGEAVGLTIITKNPTAAAGFLSFLESSPVYNQAREAGADPASALKTSSKSGAGTFILEKMGLDYLFGLHGGNRIIQAIKASGFETAQEEIQTLWQNLIRKTDIDKATNLFEGIWETAVGTAIPSFIAGLILPGIDLNVRRELINKLQKEGGLSRTEAVQTAKVMEQVVHQAKQAMETTKPSITGEAEKEPIPEVPQPGTEGKTIEEIVAEKKPAESPLTPTVEAQPAEISPELQPLAQEARKYKTAEEFVGSLKGENPSPFFDEHNWKIEVHSVDELKSNAKNFDNFPKDDSLISEYANALKRGEPLPPVMTDQSGKIIDGNNRLLAYQKAGIKKVPVLVSTGKGTGDISQLTDFFNQAVKGTPVEAPAIVDEIPVELQDRAENDWNDNYAEKYQELFTQSDELKKKVALAKGEEKIRLDKQRQEIDLELAEMEEKFVDKYRAEIEKKPEKPTEQKPTPKEKRPKREIPIDKIQAREADLRSAYSAKQNEAAKHLADILMELELAEPGERVLIKDPAGYVVNVKAVLSSFPSWIDEDLRSSDLFEKVISRLADVSKISFPEGNRPKQRKLYNTILSKLDRLLDIDTSDIRRDIMNLYEEEVKPEREPGAKEPIQRGITRGEGTEEKALPWEIDDIFKPEPPNRGTSGLAAIEDPSKRKSINKMIDSRLEESTIDPPADFKISDRAKKILEKFGVAYGEKELPRRLLGQFKALDNKVRVQALYDLTTVIHEATHAIDEKNGIYANLLLKTTPGDKTRKQITELYVDLYPSGKRTHTLEKRMREGIASLIENYFYNPASVNEKYPQLVNDFINPSGKFYHPDITELLEEANKIVAEYSRLSPEARIGARIRTGERRW